MTTDVAERTEVTAPDTTAQPPAPTKTEETNPSGGTEREGVAQTGEQAEETATLGDTETPSDPQAAEKEALRAEIQAEQAERDKATKAEEKRQAAQAAKDKDIRERAERIQGWLTPALVEAATPLKAKVDEFGNRLVSDDEISQSLNAFVKANLTLTDDLKASIHLPIQDAIQEHITEVNGEDGYKEWAKEHSGAAPSDYFKGYAEAVALKTDAVASAKADEIIAVNKNVAAAIKRAGADGEKRGKTFADGGSAGSGPSGNTGTAGSTSGPKDKADLELMVAGMHPSGQTMNTSQARQWLVANGYPVPR